MSKKLSKRTKILSILLVIIIAWGVIAIVPRSGVQGVNAFRSSDKPMLIAHRGGRQEVPENTLEAFYYSYNIDSNVVMETDVCMTSDGHIILIHDSRLDRTTNMTGLVSDYTLAQLQDNADFGYANIVRKDVNGDYITDDDGNKTYTLAKFKTGELAPTPNIEVLPTDIAYPNGVTARHNTKYLVTTLIDLLEAFPNTHMSVEIKQSGELGKSALDKVLDILDEYNAFVRVVIGSFHKEIYKYEQQLVKTTCPQLQFSPEVSGVAGLLITSWFMIDLFFTAPVTIMQVPMEQIGIQLATKQFIRTAHRHNIAVQYWTINNAEDMRHLIEIGADGIMTDYPTLLAQELAR